MQMAFKMPSCKKTNHADARRPSGVRSVTSRKKNIFLYRGTQPEEEIRKGNTPTHQAQQECQKFLSICYSSLLHTLPKENSWVIPREDAL